MVDSITLAPYSQVLEKIDSELVATNITPYRKLAKQLFGEGVWYPLPVCWLELNTFHNKCVKLSEIVSLHLTRQGEDIELLDPTMNADKSEADMDMLYKKASEDEKYQELTDFVLGELYDVSHDEDKAVLTTRDFLMEMNIDATTLENATDQDKGVIGLSLSQLVKDSNIQNDYKDPRIPVAGEVISELINTAASRRTGESTAVNSASYYYGDGDLMGPLAMIRKELGNGSWMFRELCFMEKYSRVTRCISADELSSTWSDGYPRRKSNGRRGNNDHWNHRNGKHNKRSGSSGTYTPPTPCSLGL